MVIDYVDVHSFVQLDAQLALLAALDHVVARHLALVGYWRSRWSPGSASCADRSP